MAELRKQLARIFHQRVPLLAARQAVQSSCEKHCFCEAVAHCFGMCSTGEKSGPGKAPLSALLRMACAAFWTLMILQPVELWAQTAGGPMLPSAAPAAVNNATNAAVDKPTEMVVEVRIEGNKTFPLEKITPYIRTRAGRPFSMSLIEEDLRRLDNSKLFLSVRPYYQRVPGGRIIIFKVIERPILLEIKFVGNENVTRKTLEKKSGLKAGDSIDPFAV
ncbi:MAG: POTRA domain-containing protein, partial [Thermoguttaceae bacterium]